MTIHHLALALFLASAIFASRAARSEEPMEPVAKQATSLGDFLKRPVLTEAYDRALRDYLGRDRFPCESFSGVVKRLKVLNERFPELASRLWKASGSLPVMKVEVEGATFHFRPVSRKLHAVWADASGDGCPSDGCEKADPLAPSRWTALIEGAELFWVEKDGKFLGSSVWVLPVQRNGQKYGLVSHLGPPLMKTASEDKEVLYLWWELMKPHLPREWRTMLALVPQDSNLPVAVLKELDPKKTAVVAVAREFEPTEALDELSKAFPRSCHARASTLGMELFFGDLTSVEVAKGAGIPMSEDPKATEQWLLSFAGLPPADAAAKADKPQLQKYTAALSFQLAKNPSPVVRSRAAIALGDVLKGRGFDLPAYRGPASQASSRPVPFTAPLTSALNDPDPNVRGAAALSLAGNGATSPAIQQALGQTLSPKNLAEALKPGAPPWGKPSDLLDRVPGRDLPDRALGDLFRAASQIPDARERDRALDSLADRFRAEGGERELGEIDRLIRDNPRTAQEVVDRINSSDKPCPADEELRNFIQREKARRASRTLIRAQSGFDLETFRFKGPKEEICTSEDECKANMVPKGAHTPVAPKSTSPPDRLRRTKADEKETLRPISCQKADNRRGWTSTGDSYEARGGIAALTLVVLNALGGYDLATSEKDPRAKCMLGYFHSEPKDPKPWWVGALADFDFENPDRACIMEAAQFGLPFTGLVTTVAGYVLKLPCSMMKQKPPMARVVAKTTDNEEGETYTTLYSTWDWVRQMAGNAVASLSEEVKKFQSSVKDAVGKFGQFFSGAAAASAKLIDSPEKEAKP